MTFDSRPETWFSSAVTRSRVASEPASEAAAVGGGAAICVGVMLVMAEAWMGLGTLFSTPLGMERGMSEKGVVPEASVPVTSVPDIVVSAMLAASPAGAQMLCVLYTPLAYDAVSSSCRDMERKGEKRGGE